MCGFIQVISIPFYRSCQIILTMGFKCPQAAGQLSCIKRRKIMLVVWIFVIYWHLTVLKIYTNFQFVCHWRKLMFFMQCFLGSLLFVFSSTSAKLRPVVKSVNLKLVYWKYILAGSEFEIKYTSFMYSNYILSMFLSL